MRTYVPVSLLLLALAGCAPARYECKTAMDGAVSLPDPSPELQARECRLDGKTFDFENLVIEGGGAKGIAYGGAIDVLERARIINDPGSKLRRVAGTSAGSLTAALIALGYTASEVRSILFDLDMEKFLDGGSTGLVRLLRRFGWYSGLYYRTWAECQVQRKTGHPDTNFQQLHTIALQKHLPDLYIVTTDLNHSEWRVLSYETVPCMPVALAARLSGSLPFLWNALRLDLRDFQTGPDGSCRPLAKPRKSDVFSDGGIVFNYPMPLFDTAFYVDGGDAKTEEVNPRTFGLHLDAPTSQQNRPLTIDSLPDYAKATFEAALATQDDDFEHSPCDKVRSARIDNLGIGTTEFNLTPEQKRKLIQSGFEHTCRFLQSWTLQELEKVCPTSRKPSRTPWVR